MPRIGRGVVDGLTYHVISRGNNKQRVFHNDLDYKAFVHLIEEGKRLYPIKIFAYCIMPNHFHMVLMPIKGNDLSKWMHRLLTVHAQRYRQNYGTCGHIWQGRYKNFAIQEDTHLLTVIRYVEGNPVRAGLVSLARDWEWSSHKETIGLRKGAVVDELPIELPEAWENYVNAPLAETDLEKIRQSVNRQSPYGASPWQFELCKKLGVESTLRAKGRPRKDL